MKYDLSHDQTAHLVKARTRELMVQAARRADLHPGAEEDFVAAIADKFEYDIQSDSIRLKEGAPANVSIDSIIDSTRATHPHRFRDAASFAPAEQIKSGGTFGGFANGASNDDFFAISPEEKIRVANEAKRPHGWK